MPDARGYIASFVATLRGIDCAALEQLSGLVFGAWNRHHTVFICGNGGNACNASHIAMDLVKLAAPPGGRRLRAMALGEGVAGLTAAANDIAYAEVFVEQLKAFLSPGDLVIGLSTSGASPNVLRAMEYAGHAGAITVGVTGRNGLPLQKAAHFTVVVPSADVQHIEDATMACGHMVCLRVRDLIAAAYRDTAVVPSVVDAQAAGLRMRIAAS